MESTLNYNKKKLKFCKAYTLLEILLVLVIILTLFSSLVYVINSDKKEYLYQGTLQTQTIFRLVKCNAEITGRRFCVRFPKVIGGDSEEVLSEKYKNLDILIEWEPHPIEHPNLFVNFESLNEHCRSITEFVNFLEVKSETSSEGMVMFYPDGSSDSVNITISSKFEEDNNKNIVNINGTIGSISLIVQPSPIDENSTVYF